VGGRVNPRIKSGDGHDAFADKWGRAGLSIRSRA
jgi:hypothetical protein